MTTNWKTQTISFKHGIDTVTLKGDPSLSRARISLKAMLRTIRKEKGGILVELNQMEQASALQEQDITCPDCPEELLPILLTYEQVFHMPSGLPPLRNHEHVITLKHDTYPISVRPYKYPQVQKDEIEALIKDMLLAGIIQASHSAYSSPVLLVKKKDGSWRFCVDYRGIK